MAQTGYTPIQLYRTTTAAAAPLAANLLPGELGFNIADADMALYAENASGAVKRIMNNPVGLKYPTTDGTVGQVVSTDGAGNLAWSNSGGSIAGAGGAILINNTTIGANYTIAAGTNGFSVGPITISSGYAVTVTSGQRWAVI
jgi:hypothetical protein